MCVNEAGSIRLMEEKDVEQVEELEKQCFSVPWSENILKDGLTGRFDTYLVWEKDGIVAGYCALRVLADEGEIQRIAVLPSWRRHGIAKSLMEAMIQVSKEKGAVQMSLEVRESNTGARKLYENYGFIQEAVRKNYYENPVMPASCGNMSCKKLPVKTGIKSVYNGEGRETFLSFVYGKVTFR